MADAIPFDQRDGSLWYDGKLVPWKSAQTHVLTHGLHYGSSVFEGERIYNGRIYKLKEHTARLFFSAETLGFKIPFSQDEINQACIAAAETQGIKDGFQVELPDIWLQNGNPWELKRPGIIYPIGFYGAVKDGVWAPAEKVRGRVWGWGFSEVSQPRGGGGERWGGTRSPPWLDAPGAPGVGAASRPRRRH